MLTHFSVVLTCLHYSSDPEFVEWGYGGMGSVKSADSVGNNKYSRVQGSAALGSAEGAGWGHRGRTSANDDDDGGDDDDG